jgi:integrase
VQANPFSTLPTAKGISQRERVLSDEEIAAIWRATGDAAVPYGQIVRLLVLTGQRRGEVAGMTWAELDDDLSTWTLPGSRTKNGAQHVVPLSEPARDIIGTLLPDDAEARRDRRAKEMLIFPGLFGTPYGGWSKSKAMLDRSLEAQPHCFAPWSLHDLRRTFGTGLQRLGVGSKSPKRCLIISVEAELVSPACINVMIGRRKNVRRSTDGERMFFPLQQAHPCRLTS